MLEGISFALVCFLKVAPESNIPVCDTVNMCYLVYEVENIWRELRFITSFWFALHTLLLEGTIIFPFADARDAMQIETIFHNT